MPACGQIDGAAADPESSGGEAAGGAFHAAGDGSALASTGAVSGHATGWGSGSATGRTGSFALTFLVRRPIGAHKPKTKAPTMHTMGTMVSVVLSDFTTPPRKRSRSRTMPRRSPARKPRIG